MDHDFMRGIEVRKELFGEERTRTAFASDDPLIQEFQCLITSYCFGSLWGKEGCPWQTRSLMTMCLVAAQHRFAELETHIRLGLQNGCDKGMLIEMIRHITIYCGVPTGAEAFRVAEKVLDEQVQENSAS